MVLPAWSHLLQVPRWKLWLLVRVADRPHRGILEFILLFCDHIHLSLIQPNVPHGLTPKGIVASKKRHYIAYFFLMLENNLPSVRNEYLEVLTVKAML